MLKMCFHVILAPWVCVIELSNDLLFNIAITRVGILAFRGLLMFGIVLLRRNENRFGIDWLALLYVSSARSFSLL